MIGYTHLMCIIERRRLLQWKIKKRKFRIQEPPKKLMRRRELSRRRGESLVSMVDVDFAEYRRRMDNKTVRRNVTLPNWLNQEAEKAHINVSGVLQEALMMKLGVHR